MSLYLSHTESQVFVPNPTAVVVVGWLMLMVVTPSVVWPEDRRSARCANFSATSSVNSDRIQHERVEDEFANASSNKTKSLNFFRW